MDANLIYEKTMAGEEAVRQRTRVVQRNTRMVLILVDGKSTVGDLCTKTGNAQLVESALQDLERDGLIAPQLEQDSVWEQSKKLAEEIKAAAVSRLAREEQQPATPKVPPPPEVAPVSVVPPPFSMAPHSAFPGQLPTPKEPFSTFSAFSTFGDVPAAKPRAATPPPEEKKAEGFAARLAGLFSRKSGADDLSIKPIRRGGSGFKLSLPAAITYGVLGLFALLVIVFAFYPYDRHRPQIEAAMTRLAGQPIHVGDIRAVFTPKPSIVLEGVRGDEGSGIQITRIRLVPEIFSLIGSQPVFSTVEIESAKLQAKALSAVPKVIGDAMATSAPATIRSLVFSQLEANVLGLTVGDLKADIRPDSSGKIGPIAFQSTDHALKIVLQSQAGGFVADFEAYGWRPSAESRYPFDSLQGQAVWDGRSLSIRSLDARIFDGAVLGVLLLDMGQQPTIAGDISVKHMNLQRLGNAFGYGNQFQGELAGNLKFSGSAPTWEGVLAGATGDGEVVLQRGSLGGFDLVEAVRRGKGAVRGGTTRYEQLNARLTVLPESIRLSELALVSGVLRSGGYLEFSRDGKLGGRFDVEMRGTANVVRMPVAASGPLKDPVLQGTR